MLRSDNRPRSLVVLTASVAIGVFTACGDDTPTTSEVTTVPDATDATSTTAAPTTVIPTTTAPPEEEAPPSTYVIRSGDTLFDIAAAAGVSLDDLVAANDWPDGIDHLILEGDVIQLPSPNSESPGDDDGDDGDDASAEYGPATVDLPLDADGRTESVTEPLADGIYWAQEIESDGTTVTFTLGQWFACDGDGVPDQPSVECVSGFGTLDEPSARVTLASDAAITVATGDLDDPTLADVSATEFARLANGQAPSTGAPAGYEFREFATFVRVVGGSVTEVDQFYTS